MTYAIFLDDERFPPANKAPWIICRSSQEAINLVKEKGIPTFISFDHDLGGEDTSMIFVRWMIDYCLDNDMTLYGMNYFIHSQNPIGARNIKGLIESFKNQSNS